MKTKISIIYFDEKLDTKRKHHSVSENLLNIWLDFYKKSETKMEPILLTDDTTKIPKIWKYDVVKIIDHEPPYKSDVLHKVGWMKSQSFDYLGRCLVLDLDCLIIRNIDEIDDLDTCIAMPKELGQKTFAAWPEIGEKLNGGCIFQNSNLISSLFKEYWEKKKNLLSITFLDELIFTFICIKLNGLILNKEYNTSWSIGTTYAPICEYFNLKTKIIHFHGYRKNELNLFLKNRIKL